MTKWVTHQANVIPKNQTDSREDDVRLTPRKIEQTDKKPQYYSSAQNPNVTDFKFYQKNPDTILPHRDYEENECVSFTFYNINRLQPPPGMDSYITEKINQNGQYLYKNQTYNQEEIARKAKEEKWKADHALELSK